MVRVFLAAILCTILSSPVVAQEMTFRFNLESTGGLQTIGYNRTWQTPMTTERPANITKEPKYKNAPLYCQVPFSDISGRAVTFVLDEDADDARLYVDANANGDLTDDPIPAAKRRVTPEERRKTVIIWLYYDFYANVQGAYGNKETAPLGLHTYIYSKADRERNKIAPVLLYYRDYCRTGSLTLGGKAYRAVLADDNSDGRYDSKPVPEFKFNGDLLLVDTDASGKFERSYEAFALNQPFNIGGTTYEVASVSPSGGDVTLKRSDKSVPIRKPPPVLKTGEKAPEIAVSNFSGEPFSLASHRGKIILLDFWATWCGPCIEEMPEIAKLYRKYNPKGLEVIGISLDQPKDGAKAAKFVQDNAIPWPQVHDASRDISKRYYVSAIPQMFLIGRDGQILATGLHGEALEKAVAAALK